MRNSLIGAALRILRLFWKIDTNRVVILPSANAGSLGDQAMIDSISRTLIEDLNRRVTVIGKRSKAVKVRPEIGFAYTDAPGLGGKWATLKAIFSAKSLLFIGADVIDGGYGGDCRRLILLDIAARAGMQTAAINFSIAETIRPAALARIKALPPLPMHARDPVSLERFEAQTGRPAIQVADVAFLLKPEARAENAIAAIDWCRGQRAAGRKILAVNAGGTTLNKMKGDGLGALGACLEGWLADDPHRAILLLPHDYKPQPVGDVEPLREIRDRLAPRFADRIHMVDFPFDTWDVKAMAAELDFALLARMHFGIACLGQGVPPLCVAYQGKFEGLMHHVGLDPAAMMLSYDEAVDAAALRARLDAFEADLPRMKAEIAARLPGIRDLSRKNFAWL